MLVDPEIGKAGDIDTAVISLKFANGALGIIENSRKAVYGYDQRVEVFGAKGTAMADNNTPTSMVVLNESGTIRDKPLYFFLERYKTLLWQKCRPLSMLSEETNQLLFLELTALLRS